jgi:hypothetical protein
MMTVLTGKAFSSSQQLRFKIQMVLPEMAATARTFWRHPRLAELYPDFLGVMHGLVRASVPLMEAALARSRAMAATDSVSAAIAPYFEHHIPEERGHDDWILGDLRVLGIDPEAMLRRPPSVTVAEMVGAQYYWINHYHPVALLGYIAVIEGYPPSLDGIADAIARTGYPPEAFRTLAKHARLDVRHRDDLNRLLDQLPLAPEHEAVLGISALRTADLTCRLIEGLTTD